MEDFGSIVWALVLVGFGIYSIAAKARKKDTNTPKKQPHGEAWPSWDPWAEETAREEKQKNDAEEEYVSMKPEFEEGTDAEPAFADEQMYAGSCDNKVFKTVSVSVEQSGIGGKLKPGYKDPATQQGESETPIETDADTTDVNAAESIDFDLRKAVVYSEILKPKFED